MRVIRLLFSNLGAFRKAFLFIFVVGMLDGAVVFFVPVLLAEYTKHNFSPGVLWKFVPLLIACYLASHVMQWVLRRYGEAFGPRYAMHLRQQYFGRIEALPVERLARYHSGYLLSLVSSVSSGLGNLAIEMFWGVSRSVVNLGLFFYFTALESIWIAVANLFILISFVVLSARLSRRIVPLASRLNLEQAVLTATYADFGANVMTVKKLGIQNFANKRIARVSEENVRHLERLQRFHAYRWFFLHTLFSLAMVLTITFLLREIALGNVSPAVLIIFTAAFIAVRMNAERLSEDFKTVVELDAYVESLFDVLEAENIPQGTKQLHKWSEVELRDIVYQHRGSSVEIRVPRLAIRQGERIGIVGTSGQGKTTVLHLLANFYLPRSGTRRIDTLTFEELAPDVFTNLMVLASQEVELLNISVRDNLALGKAISDETLLVLLDELGLRDWIESVADGLDSVIGEKGVTVSQGQKQRLNLARSYLFDRDIYLLDEPTSHLDPENQERVMQFVERRLSGKTLIIVSHNDRILDLCSAVYEMKESTLKKTGPELESLS